jgi:hypothetical protein
LSLLSSASLLHLLLVIEEEGNLLLAYCSRLALAAQEFEEAS